MVVHIVSFKYKKEVDAPARTQHRERLAGLRDLDGIVDLKSAATSSDLPGRTIPGSSSHSAIAPRSTPIR